MSLTLPITEDTPPDMLAGAMDLYVVLPNGRDMKMCVDRSTPMMDLLVQITTANKISPGGHVIQAIGERGILPYKPSTPIGALDTWSIHIVTKKNATKSLPRQSTMHHNTPFEQTFRLQVNLPRNQLYVSRVSYKTRLENILREVCEEKNLDPSKYCFIHPEKLDEELELTKTFLDYKIQQVTLCSNNNRRPVQLSSVDIMALKRCDKGNQPANSKYYTSHSYDGSISSGSMEGRSLSPVRSDESSSSPIIPKANPNSILNRPPRKRRPAPKPPSTSRNDQNYKYGCESLTISHSRNSSDSSGYHESLVLSESPLLNTNELDCSLLRRSKLPSSHPHEPQLSNQNKVKIANTLSRSLSNLAIVGNKKSNALLSAMKHKPISVSSMSLASAGRKKKAPAPPPPTSSKSLLCLKEEEITDATSEFIPKVTEIVKLPPAKAERAQDKPDSNTFNPPVESKSCDKLSHLPPYSSVSNRVPVQNLFDVVDSTSTTYNTQPRNYPDCPIKDFPTSADHIEKDCTIYAEIDTIFNDLTKGYVLREKLKSPSSPENSTEEFLATKEEFPSYDCNYNSLLHSKAFKDEYSTKSSTFKTSLNPEAILLSTNKVLSCENVTSKDSKPHNHVKNGDNSCSNIKNQCDSELDPPTNNYSTLKKHGTSSVGLYGREEVKKLNWSTKNELRTAETSCTMSHDNCNYVDSNYTSTHDSGLGSDDSIPSVSEGKGPLDETTVNLKKVIDAQENQKRGSTLDNFTISTYQNVKPTSIFHDDSIKTSKSTLMATSGSQFVSESNSNTLNKLNGLSRHSSFNTERNPPSMIRRSKSHISLLSGNFTKFNRLINKFSQTNLTDVEGSNGYNEHPNEYCKEHNVDYLSRYSRNVVLNTRETKRSTMGNGFHLRRTISEISLSRDCNKEVDESLELPDQYVEQEGRSDVAVEDGSSRINSELQSIQVLKGILPQIKHKQTVDKYIGAEPALTFIKLSGEQSSDSTNLSNTVRSSTRASSYIDPAPPNVNLLSWNERPKRQIRIKTDQDYVFGNVRKSLTNNSVINQESMSKYNESCENINVDDSQIPVVRAVEFKKPFSRPKSEFYSKDTALNVQGNDFEKLKYIKPVLDEQKIKPTSSYLFGENLSKNSSYTEQNSLNQILDESYYEFNKKIVEEKSQQRSQNYTFKVYKDKFLENEKLSLKIVGNNRIEGQQMKICSQYEEKENFTNDFKIGLFGKNNISCIKSSIFDSSKKSGNFANTSVPIPPPISNQVFIPALVLMPKKGLSYSQKTNQKLLGSDENSRAQLLSSIKHFNRSNLRKQRVK